jgi:hypothetical protein
VSAPALKEAAVAGREAARSLNEAVLLREALVREIRALGALYVVGKRRPISELSPEKQEQVRQAYASTHWSSDYGVEIICVCTSKKLADEICVSRGPNYFHTKVPVDSPLTDEVVFGEWAHTFPGSDATEMYENLQSATVAVPASQLRIIEEEAERLLEIIKTARAVTLGSS